MKELDEKNVVTCFLEYNRKILILKRSEVGSYQGKWAGVSGYVENEKPYKTALNEIFEEVNLKEKDLKLVKKGKVFPIPDEESGILRMVHPYLFFVKNPGKIRIDWEHKEKKFIDPKDIGKHETVPKLKETLEKVYTPWARVKLFFYSFQDSQ